VKIVVASRVAPNPPSRALYCLNRRNETKEFGRYGIYWYYRNPKGIEFTGLAVVTRDGKLLRAESGSCGWRYRFFWVADADIDRDYTAYEKAIQAARERHRVEIEITLGRKDFAEMSRIKKQMQEEAQRELRTGQ
jgi:hypothetical protein